MESESSSPYSQVPAICPYPEPTPSSLHPLHNNNNNNNNNNDKYSSTLS